MDNHIETRTFVSEISGVTLNSILKMCRNKKDLLIQITEFSLSGEEVKIFCRRLKRYSNGQIQYYDEKITPPGMTIIHTRGTYLAYSRPDTQVIFLGTAGQNSFSNVPIIREN